ncbi:MAG: hypothetical protein KAJ07_09715 [Planctomycetes bacterium]|nr:hypothetical protein [Planctomycetota bacterium]
MEIIHKRGGKFLLIFEPLELQLMHMYKHQLKNSAVTSVDGLLGAMFQQQIDFMHDCLQGFDTPGIEEFRSKIPAVSPN